MKKICFLTFNDLASGIYSGQVIDVCQFWKEKLDVEVKLVAFISIRNFVKNKSKIKFEYPGAIVLPMFPKTRNWKLNRFLLKKYIRSINPEVIVARGPFATLLALNFRNGRRICFDARGAYTAELTEYNVVPDEKVKGEILEIERKAVLESDFRLAVSEKLVDYWRNSFQYLSEKHVVIPCTLNQHLFRKKYSVEEKWEIRKRLGVAKGDVVLIYSGSSAEWQSLQSLDHAIYKLLERQKNLQVILLAKPFTDRLKIQTDFPNQVKQMWVKSNDVSEILQASDYGWLVREDSITNQVASPVKFAEYLFSGLKIIISNKLGDYSDLVIKHNLGIIYSENFESELIPISNDEKERMFQLSEKFFSKKAHEASYKKLLSI